MAKDVTPSAWIASWSEDGTDITIPIASITNLTAAEADGSTGDIRKVLFDLLEEIYLHQEAIAADADKPEKMLITRSNAITSSNGGELKTTYSYAFYSDMSDMRTSAINVSDEP